MLVIRRRLGESLLIGDEIEVEVLEASGTQVKLGIRAPKAIPVLRKEIVLVGTQNQAAARFISTANAKQMLEKLKAPSPTPISPV